MGITTVGLPRAMSYYYLYPYFKTFFAELGVELVPSPPTTKKIMKKMGCCPTDEPCLAVKLFFAHSKELIDQGINRLLVPCLVSLEPKSFCCPKFMGIPYMVRNAFNSATEVIIPKIDRFQGRDDWHDSFVQIGAGFGANRSQVLAALQKAAQVHHHFEQTCVDNRLTTPEAYALLDGQLRPDTALTINEDLPTVGVLGHPYILYDSFGIDILAEFRKYANVLTAEMVPAVESRRQMARIVEGERLWNFEAQILGAALYYLENRLVDKLVLVGSFECGPESIIESYVESETARHGIPLLILTMDEHTGEAGLLTRIEAFMDIQPVPKSIHEEPHPAPLNTPGPRPDPMVIGMPTMGHLDVAIRSALNDCGVQTLQTPHASKEIIELGKVLAPEFVCLPFTITMGQMRWLLEHGATSILMVGGKGKCRLGWYAQIQELFLRRLGYRFDMLIVDSPLPFAERWANFRDVIKRATDHKSWLKILKALYCGYHKMAAIDGADQVLHRLRAFEAKPGTADRLFEQFIHKMEQASLVQDVWRLKNEFSTQIAAVPVEETDPVRVRVLGEIWVTLEAHANMHVEKMLGKSADPRVWVDRELSATTWFHQHLFPVREVIARKHQIAEAAGRYLDVEVGGHGYESVGLTALAREEGMDGVVHLMPFTCMPEIVAQNIMVRVSQDKDIPVLTHIITDQTGEAGFETRVEAFLDILKDRRQAGYGAQVALPQFA